MPSLISHKHFSIIKLYKVKIYNKTHILKNKNNIFYKQNS